ncbi:Uncharacterised protein [Serratia liquefaciens]|nr:Uncharacterised protein [Serratia liquefaciens]
MWWAVAKFVAVIVASYVLNTALAPRQKSNTPEAATEDDWNLPEPTEGTPQCIFFWRLLERGLVCSCLWQLSL